MEVYELNKIIGDVVASFEMDHLNVPDGVIENIRCLYLRENNLNGKRRIKSKSKESLKDDKGRK